VALLIALVTGCSGPSPQLSFGGKAVPVNVAFGGPADGDPRVVDGPVVDFPAPAGLGVVPTSPLPANALPGVSVPLATVPGAKSPPTTRPPVLEPCPTRDPFSFPISEADNQVRTDVRTGTYPYRVSGTATGAEGSGPFNAVVAHTFAKLGQSTDGTRTFTDSFSQFGVDTVATYKARPSDGLNAGNVGTEASTGEVELSSIVSRQTAGPASSFAPSGSGLRYIQLRATDGVTWRDASNDPTTRSTVTINGKILSRSVVDACGQPVSAWQVAATQTIVTPSENITSTVNRWIATQYGGIVVKEEVAYSGTKNGTAIQGRYVSTIARDPGR